MNDLPRRRLALIAALIGALLVTLTGRLVYVQALNPAAPPSGAAAMDDGTIVLPAPRGQIVDAHGRPLVTSRVSQVLTVDRETLQQLPDHGAAVLARLGALLDRKPADLAAEITPCGVNVPSPCWTGQPYQPVPVLTDAPTAVVLAVAEHREEYPGVAVEAQSVLDYPGGSLAANLLGYTGAVNADDEKADPTLADVDTIGRAGLQAQYDQALRGVDGEQIVARDARGYATGTVSTVAPTPGDTLVTSIDAKVQALAEKALADQIAAQRAMGRPATSGAVVVMDPNTGRIVAAASYPTYDPQLFVGGISAADYAKLTAPSANDPLVDRAIGGAFPPGSTFKLITASSDATHGEVSLTGTYPCPGSLNVDGLVKTNFDSESFGHPLTLRQALQFSCDTFFYAPAVAEYRADEDRIAAGGRADEYLQKMAAAFGVGTAPGVDLPAGEQASGGYADRATRLARWKANRAQYCADAKRGYPNVADAAQRAYLTKLANENCTDGWRYRAGDNADLAIGQGETTMSPLQLAIAYSAMLNGGKIWQPTIGWAVLDPSGKVVRRINPTVTGRAPVSQTVLDYIADSLRFDDSHTVSGAIAFDGAPYKTRIGGKTGTAEVFGKLDTSWFASWGPVGVSAQGDPTAKLVIVGMIEQTGTGASAAAPMVRQIYDGIFGVGQPSVLPGAKPATTLPKLSK